MKRIGLLTGLLVFGLFLGACSLALNSEEDFKYIDSTELVEIIMPSYDEAYPYSEGYAVVGQRQNQVMKYNYIDTEGNLLLKDWVDFADSFSEGLAVIGLESKPVNNRQAYLFGYINGDGEMVISPAYHGTKEYRPRPFYNGYAEVNWIDVEKSKINSLENSVLTNIINVAGEKQFEFDSRASYTYSESERDWRILDVFWQWDKEDYAVYHPWMREYVEKDQFKALLFDAVEEKTYLVNQSKEILKELSGFAFWDEKNPTYIRVYPERFTNQDPYVSLVDDEGNVVLEGLDSVESGLNDAFIVGSIDNERMTYSIMDKDGNRLINENYITLFPMDDHYLAMDEERHFYLLDDEGNKMVDFNDDIDSVSPLFSYENGSIKKHISVVAANLTEEDGTASSCLYDLNGKLLSKTATGSYQSLGNQLIGLYDEGNYKLLNTSGKTVLELPRSGYGVIQRYVENGFDLTLSNYEEQRVYYFEIRKNSSQWEAKEIAERAMDEHEWSSDVEHIIAQNEESRINSSFSWDGDLQLEDKKGNILIPMKEKAALSLIENSYYLTVDHLIENVDESGMRSFKMKGMSLHRYQYDFKENDYEQLGQLSEGKISFMEEGKWGYLELK